MITFIAWAYIIWQAWRATKKLLGFSDTSWEEVFAPTFVLAALAIFMLLLGLVLAVCVSMFFTII